MTEAPRPSDLVKDEFPDAPATGAAATDATSAPTATDRPSIDYLEEAMRDVVDPELMVNVVDLGLVEV